jgi:hypothetical protein
MAKSASQCTEEEAMRYIQAHFATVELIAEAFGKYDILATDAQTAAARGDFRARALEAGRDLELLKSKRRAFMADVAAINPPSEATVLQAEERAAALADIIASEANASAILDLTTKGLTAFNKIHAA